MSAHTPGPWKVGGDGEWVTGPDRSAPVICDLVPRDDKQLGAEDDANARLIAAAPDYHAAVADLLSVTTHILMRGNDLPPELKKAIERLAEVQRQAEDGE